MIFLSQVIRVHEMTDCAKFGAGPYTGVLWANTEIFQVSFLCYIFYMNDCMWLLGQREGVGVTDWHEAGSRGCNATAGEGQSRQAGTGVVTSQTT